MANSIINLLSDFSSVLSPAIIPPAVVARAATERKPPIQSLEAEFGDLVFGEIDVNQDVGFQDFLNPNEAHPENIQPHLQGAAPGLIVAPGTERIFFDLIYADEEKCVGLAGRDINPRTKAYDDFNILLFKITDNVEDYFKLSDVLKVNSDDFRSRIESIKVRMKKECFKTEKERAYYSKNLEAFAKIYFLANAWRKPINQENFSSVRYYLNKDQYLKIRRYVISGNVITTIGPINDLRFLKNRAISIVDTSNIRGYSLINLQGNGNFKPKIIWTVGTGNQGTDYHSIPHQEILSDDGKLEYDQLIELLQQCKTLPKGEGLAMALNNLLVCSNRSIEQRFHYSKLGLQLLKDHVAARIIKDNSIGPIDTTNGLQIQTLTLEQIDQLVKNPQLPLKLPKILSYWVYLTSHQYLGFCQTEGWQNAFKSAFNHRTTNLPGFLEKIREAGLEEAFRDRFGREEFKKFERDFSML